MKKGAKYTKFVEWSDEDNCFIGSCPELMYGGSYGDDATKVSGRLADSLRRQGQGTRRQRRDQGLPERRSRLAARARRS